MLFGDFTKCTSFALCLLCIFLCLHIKKKIALKRTPQFPLFWQISVYVLASTVFEETFPFQFHTGWNTSFKLMYLPSYIEGSFSPLIGGKVRTCSPF